MQLTQKIRIFPNKTQEETLWGLSEVCRKLYNTALSERLACWFNDYDVSRYDQQNKLPRMKKDNTELRCVYSKVLQMVVGQLDKDFKSAIALQKMDENASFPRFKGKKYFTTMQYNQSGFSVASGSIEFSHKLNGTNLKFKIPGKFSSMNNVKQVALYRNDDKFFVSVTHERETPEYHDNGKYQAIDLGITDIVTAVNMDGKFLKVRNQRPDKYWQKKIEVIQSRRDHCKKRSRKWNILNNNLKRMRRKCANQIKDFQHKLSRKLIDNTKANTIIIGDLSAKQMSKKKKKGRNSKQKRGLHRAIQNTGTIGRFSFYLTYKAELAGKKAVKKCERHTTSDCCCCGKRHNMTLADRNMICDCGNVMDRDENSSVNIMTKYLSQNARCTGLSEFQANLRNTGVPIVGTALAGSPLR